MKDKQDAVEVVEDKKKNLKVMKMMCIYFLFISTLSFSIISICFITSDESFLPVPSQYFHPQVPPYSPLP